MDTGLVFIRCIIVSYHYSLDAYIVPLGLAPVAFAKALLGFECFLVFWNKNLSQAHFVFFLPQIDHDGGNGARAARGPGRGRRAGRGGACA